MLCRLALAFNKSYYKISQNKCIKHVGANMKRTQYVKTVYKEMFYSLY